MNVADLKYELSKHDDSLPVLIGGGTILDEDFKIEFDSEYGIVLRSESLTYFEDEQEKVLPPLSHWK